MSATKDVVLLLGSGPNWISEVKKSMKTLLELQTNKAVKGKYIVKIVDKSILPDVLLDTEIPKELKSFGIVSIEFNNTDVFEFLTLYSNRDIKFIYSSRMFEHLQEKDIFYLLYLLYSVSKKNAFLRIIVPDFLEVLEELEKLSVEDCSVKEFREKLTSVTTEIFNEPSDPHKSVWTTQLAEYYITTEKYWDLLTVKHTTVDNRSWYLDITAKRNEPYYCKKKGETYDNIDSED